MELALRGAPEGFFGGMESDMNLRGNMNTTITRLRRITDLFVEGETIHLGDDEAGKPVLIWINKLNAFEIEESRRDGIVARGLKMRDLGDETNPERTAFDAEIRLLSDEELRKACVNQRVEEMYLDVIDEVEIDPEMRDKIEMLRRLPEQLADAGVADDDPRHAQLTQVQTEYLEAIRKGQEKRQAEALKDAEQQSREDLAASHFEKWRERQTLDLFMEERRITEIFVSARECYATAKEGGGWDHRECDHNQQLLPERALVKKLPPSVVEQMVETLDRITSTARESGNSDAPASSSESSERSSAPEAPSIPSSPDETPGDAPTS